MVGNNGCGFVVDCSRPTEGSAFVAGGGRHRGGTDGVQCVCGVRLVRPVMVGVFLISRRQDVSLLPMMVLVGDQFIVSSIPLL